VHVFSKFYINDDRALMSKHFDAKKESISLGNKSFTERSDVVSLETRYRLLEDKYKKLVDRIKKVEKVYQFHKGVVQNISSGIITTDFEGIITFINATALKLIDYEYSELVGKSIRTLFADQGECDQILDTLLKHKKMFESKEVNLLTRSKKLIPVGFTTTLLDIEDVQYNGVVFSFRDLTNIHNFRNRLERIDRLATLGEVSAGIAHEIRNPLAGIKSSAQVLEDSFSPGDFRSELIRRIIKEIDRSNELLKKFFKFAKPGKPKQDFVAVENLVKGVQVLLSSRMSKKNIMYTPGFDPRLPNVYVDENQIEQVLINLFLNAIDAMEQGGNLSVSARMDSVKDSETRLMVIVEIADTGCGIEKENIKKIFNPFFTTKSEGVGLGLSISSRLLEENGGRIEVESQAGKGSCFYIYLPTG
jgi:PAS domain S-box-containing protein